LRKLGTMDKEQEEVWDRLKHGVNDTTLLSFHGNGIATRFNSAWFGKVKFVKVMVNDIAQSQYRDFCLDYNDIVFYKPPALGHLVSIEVYY